MISLRVFSLPLETRTVVVSYVDIRPWRERVGKRKNREGSAIGRESLRRDLVFSWPTREENHEAVIHFNGEASMWRAHSIDCLATDLRSPRIKRILNGTHMI